MKRLSSLTSPSAASKGRLLEQEREVWLDCLRGLAATSVVFFHLWQMRRGIDNLYDRAASFGWLGVPVFFVVSGYCIYVASAKIKNPQTFFLKRFLRIYPPYLASLFVVCSIIAVRVFLTGTNDITVLPRSYEGFIYILALLTEPVTSVKAINWVYWTLTVELSFYLIVALSLVFKRFFLIFLCVVTIVSCLPGAKTVSGLFFLEHWGQFGLGFGLAAFIRGYVRSAYFLMISSMLSVIANEAYPSIIITAFAALSISLARLKPARDILSRGNILAKLGQISYSLYLIHVPIGVIGVRAFLGHQNVPRTFPMVLVYDLSVVVLCIAAAIVMFIYVEKPSLQYSRRIGRKTYFVLPTALVAAASSQVITSPENAVPDQ